MARNQINLVAVQGDFLSPSALLVQVEKKLREFTGKQIIILFSENVLGETPIPRITGKQLADALSKAVTKHGKAYVAYSVYEKAGKHQVITNSGYLVFPKPAGTKKGYQVYSKISTYRNGGDLTEGDERVLKRNSSSFKKSRKRIYSLSRKIKAFPRIQIGEKEVELRICRDLAEEQNLDKHPAKTRIKEADLILVPAKGLTLRPNELIYLTKHLTPDGLAVLMDPFGPGLDNRRKPVNVIRRNKEAIEIHKNPKKLPWKTKRRIKIKIH